MNTSWVVMGMTAKLMIPKGNDSQLQIVKNVFTEIDEKFSVYKSESLISKLNRSEISANDDSELSWILNQCRITKAETGGYFDCEYGGKIDPSGLVKGYAIDLAAKTLEKMRVSNFLIEIGGDIQTKGTSDDKEDWKIGISNPFNPREIVKVVSLHDLGIATSGTAVHSDHIINPKTKKVANEIASISVIAKSVYDADRMATAVFAMGIKGIELIEHLKGYEGYMITKDSQAVMTSGFDKYA